MANPIKDTDIFQGGVNKLQGDINKISASIDGLNTSLTKLQTSTKKIDFSKGSQSLKKLNDNKSQSEILTNKLVAAETKLKNARSKLGLALERQKSALTEQNRLNKEAIKLEEAQVGSIKMLQLQTNKLVKARASLGNITGKNQKQFQALTTQINNNNKALLKHDQAIGRGQRNVGKYGTAIKGLALRFAGALGLTSGIFLAINAVRKMIGTFSDFTAMTSKVKAISGATQEQFKALTEAAKKLGETTVFTATNVAQLQLNLSKLGLTPDQILKSQQGILDLAAATGEDLADSATVAASTMRAFGLEADQMGRITDVMAKSFSSSALNLEKFSVAMRSVAPVAKNAGVSLEETTAILSSIVDAGVDASTAGTALRNVYLELSKQGITWNDALEKINNATDKNKVALELFGKRGATVATIIASNIEKTEKLTKVYKESAGSAKLMADIMLNNLAGDAKIAASATEGLAIAIGEKLEPFLRSSVRTYTKVVSEITKWIKGTKELDKEVISFNRNLSDELAVMNSLFFSLRDAAEGTDERRIAIDEINSKYGKYLENLLTEESTLEEIEKAQTNATNALIKQIAIKSKQADIENAINKNLEVQKSVMRDVVDAGNDNNVSAQRAVAITNELAKELRDLGFTTEKNLGLNKLTEEQYNLISKAAYKLGLTFGDLEGNVNDLVEAQILQEDSIKAINDFYKAYIDNLELSENALNDETKAIDRNTQARDENIIRLKRSISEIQILLGVLKESNNAEEKIKNDLIARGEDTMELRTSATDAYINQQKDEVKATLESDKAIEDLARQSSQLLFDIASEAVSKRLDKAKEEVEFHEDRIDELEDQLDREIRLAELGAASNIDVVQKELAAEKAARDKALQEEAAAQKKKEQIQKAIAIANTAETLSNLIVSASKITKGFTTIPIAGLPLAIAAVASLFAMFKAFSSNVRGSKFEKGGTEVLGGKRHSQGGTDLGVLGEGEVGERASIFSRKATSKYDKQIVEFTNAINNDTFGNMDLFNLNFGNKNLSSPVIVNNYSKLLKEQQTTNKILNRNNDLLSKFKMLSPDGKTVTDIDQNIIHFK